MENLNPSQISNLPQHDNTIVGGTVSGEKNENKIEAGHVVPENKVDVELNQQTLEEAKSAATLTVSGQSSLELSSNKRQTLIKILDNIDDSIMAALRLLKSDDEVIVNDLDHLSAAANVSSAVEQNVGTIIEGVFDGEKMVASDGQVYEVPPNYASKSKLVEGDLLKLSITSNGKFIYKQIGPVERDRIKGNLIDNPETGEYGISCGDKVYRVLKASVSYYKGEKGDEVIILVPKGGQSNFAAVENIIKAK